MRVIARSTLKKFIASLAARHDQTAIKEALDVWFSLVSKADWKNAADVRKTFASASIINSERIVFNIKGNDFRLVVSTDFDKSIIWIKWVGTHKDYDRIDVAKVQYD